MAAPASGGGCAAALAPSPSCVGPAVSSCGGSGEGGGRGGGGGGGSAKVSVRLRSWACRWDPARLPVRPRREPAPAVGMYVCTCSRAAAPASSRWLVELGAVQPVTSPACWSTIGPAASPAASACCCCSCELAPASAGAGCLPAATPASRCDRVSLSPWLQPVCGSAAGRSSARRARPATHTGHHVATRVLPTAALGPNGPAVRPPATFPPASPLTQGCPVGGAGRAARVESLQGQQSSQAS